NHPGRPGDPGRAGGRLRPDDAVRAGTDLEARRPGAAGGDPWGQPVGVGPGADPGAGHRVGAVLRGRIARRPLRPGRRVDGGGVRPDPAPATGLTTRPGERTRSMPTPLCDYAARRIALIKPSALGDIVHSLPVLTAVRRRYPDAHITWVVN